MALAQALYIADVAHARSRPKRNQFRYMVYYLCFPLQQVEKLACGLLSVEKPNLFSYYGKDHGDGKQPPLEWVRGVLSQYHMPEADGEVVLLTMPRLLGYGFNPVSFYFCLDRGGALRAVISEVTNTFGDRHSYVCFHDDRRVITRDDQMEARKVMHVSPFCDIEGHYRFRFAYGEEKLGVWIDYYDRDGLLITTSMVGKRRTLNAAALLTCFFRYPLITLKVIGLIHYQALKLWLKGIRYRRRPTPIHTETSR